MRVFEVTYPLTFVVEVYDDDEPSRERIAEGFQNTIWDWLDNGGTVWEPSLQIHELKEV